jgi:hypothetical protein
MHDDEKATANDEALAKATDALMKNAPLPKGASPEELQMAAQLKSAFSKPQLRKAFDENMEALLLQKFAKPVEREEKTPWWQTFFMPAFGSAAVAFAALALIVVIQFTQPEPTQTLAQVQGFESLTTAEEILGELPADSVTKDGVLVADLRLELHNINSIRQSADLTLDPTAEQFPHTELRSAALDLIDQELKVSETLRPTGLARLLPVANLTTFAGKVSGWPTTNEGVPFEIHEKAVNSFIEHGKAWDEAMEALAESIVIELKSS